MTTTPRLSLAHLLEGARNNIVRINTLANLFDATLAPVKVIGFGTNTPPGSPSNGDVHVVGSSPTGAFASHAGEIALWNTSVGWTFITLTAVSSILIWDETAKVMRLGSGTVNKWAPIPMPLDAGGAGTANAVWTGAYTAGGKAIMRQKHTFSGMSSGVAATAAHGVTSPAIDLATILVSGRARNATQTWAVGKLDFGNGQHFDVWVDGTNVNCKPNFTPTGWSVDVFVDYASQ